MSLTHRTGADHVQVVSHMCREATHIASVEVADGKDDSEFVTVMNPAVSFDTSERTSMYLSLTRTL